MKAREELRLWLVGRQRWLHQEEGVGWGEANKGENVCGVGGCEEGLVVPRKE